MGGDEKFCLMGDTEININIPASKSIVNRALIIEKLSGKSLINKKDISCDDTKVLSQVLSLSDCRSSICHCGLDPQSLEYINIKNSGTAMRFMAAYLTQKVGNWLLIGSESMQSRPIDTLVNALRTLGAEIKYYGKNGFLPVKICTKTPLNPQNAELTIENSDSSQTISALMLIAPNFTNGLKINIKNCASFPYILLTKKIMEDYGAEVQINDNQIFVLSSCHCGLDPQSLKNSFAGANLKFVPKNTTHRLKIGASVIEADWDSAAFWYAFLATNEKHKKITLTNLFSDSYQPDSIVKDIFEKFGIKTVFNNSVTLQKETKIVLPKQFDFNFEYYPDLVPIMAVTCCFLDVKFNFSGVQHLRIKESNRLDALQNELKKCGFLLTQTENSLQWLGEKCEPQKSPKIETYNDHRIAMAFAILKQKINLKILNPKVVSKSYKNFWKDYGKLQMEIVS